MCGKEPCPCLPSEGSARAARFMKFASAAGNAQRNNQKFFGSFFQKRTASLLRCNMMQA
jgi:hypothetical protein